MPILSDNDLAAIQNDIYREFDRTCSIISRSEESDGGGGSTWVETVIPNVPCFIMPEILTPRLDLSEKVTADEIVSATGWIFTLPAKYIVQAKYELLSGGYRYEVTAVLDYPKSNNIVSRVIATQLR